ncbi:MAG: sensor domain-containing phosphodiesterase [Mycobacterium sp.]|nr:sensor domain-containing phosphodiesterase [Mycobacterium sp.]
MPLDLNRLVSKSAELLSGASANDAVEVSEQVLTDIADYFGLDVAFLRHNDHSIRATRLIAQWPIRSYIPDPDPIGTVYFEEADPIFAMAEHLKEPSIVRPAADPEFQQRIEEGTTIPAISMAGVPLLSPAGVTEGTLGFIKYGDREWTTDEISGLQLIAALFSNLKTRLESDAALKWLATHDDLTGLANRRRLLDCLERRLAPNQPGPVAILYIDLDRLKAINDLLGHESGDQALSQFAARLCQYAGDDTVLARLGGDELIAVFNDPMPLEDALTFAQRIRPTLQNRLLVAGGFINCTVSIGVAVGIPGLDSVSDLMSQAEDALAAAKAAGGNGIAIFTDELAAKRALHTDIELHLPDALESADLFLQYQPEVDLRTGAVVAIESQLCWNHPTHGPLKSETFIPVTETINLAAALDRRILWLACEQLQRWRNDGLATDIPLRVKVSPVLTITEGLVEYLTDALAHFDLPAKALSLEIAESIVVAEAAASRDTLLGLKDLGVGLVLDHFGTGYSDLAGLKSLPIDTVKVDRSFVQNLNRDPGDIAIIRSVIALANAFGLVIVADGLQTATAAEILVREGCLQAQGPLLSPPLDAPAMGALLKNPVIRPPLPTSVQHLRA